MIHVEKYEPITEIIIGSAFDVHKHLGNGFQEVINCRTGIFAARMSLDISAKKRTDCTTGIQHLLC